MLVLHIVSTMPGDATTLFALQRCVYGRTQGAFLVVFVVGLLGARGGRKAAGDVACRGVKGREGEES